MSLSQALPGRRLSQHCVRACGGHAMIDTFCTTLLALLKLAIRFLSQPTVDGNTARRQHPCYRRFRAADSPNTCSDIQHDTVKTHGRGRAPNAHSRPLQTQAPHRPGGRGRAAPAHGVTRRGPFTARRNAAAVVWSLHGAMPQRWCVCGARGPRLHGAMPQRWCVL